MRGTFKALKEKNSMAVIKQDDGLWLVDISDGKSSLTGKRIRHRKSNFLTKKGDV